MSGHQTGGPEPGRERQLGSVQQGAGGGRGLPMATDALEAVLPGLQLPPAIVAAGGTPEAVRPSGSDEPPGAGVVVGEQALKGDETGGDFGHRMVPHQECHANIPSSDIPNTTSCIAGTMCISNSRESDVFLPR